MSLINKLNFVPLTVTPEQQPEVKTEPPASQLQTNTGIANTADGFVTESPSDLNKMIDQQSQTAAPFEPAANQEESVDPSSMFSYFESSVPQFDSRSAKLNEELNSLKARRRELQTGLQEQLEKKMEVLRAVDTVSDALRNDKPIPESLLPTLGSLGILGIIGGLPLLPILGALGLFTGLTLEYKQKAKKAQAELEKQAGEMDLSTESMQSDLEDVDREIESLMEKMKSDASPSKEFYYRGAIVEESAFHEFVPDENVKQENNAFTASLDRTVLEGGNK
jgi:hypothetical protein